MTTFENLKRTLLALCLAHVACSSDDEQDLADRDSEGSSGDTESAPSTTGNLMTDTQATAGGGESTESGTADAGGSTGSDIDPILLHDGYWASQTTIPGLGEATIVNDMHVDLETRRATVYAQVQAMGMVISPPQVGPGECTEFGEATVCFHPNSIYLNASGQELEAADGSGAWWVKHSWIVGGEGYDNCELMPILEVYDCITTTGRWADDGVAMSMEIGTWGEPASQNNVRSPHFDTDPPRYTVDTFVPANSDPGAGELDLTPVMVQQLTLTCADDQASPFDGQTRPYPAWP